MVLFIPISWPGEGNVTFRSLPELHPVTEGESLKRNSTSTFIRRLKKDFGTVKTNRFTTMQKKLFKYAI